MYAPTCTCDGLFSILFMCNTATVPPPPSLPRVCGVVSRQPLWVPFNISALPLLLIIVGLLVQLVILLP